MFYVVAFDSIKIFLMWALQNDRQSLSFVKVGHTYGKKWPEKVVQRSFIKGHSFPYRL